MAEEALAQKLQLQAITVPQLLCQQLLLDLQYSFSFGSFLIHLYATHRGFILCLLSSLTFARRIVLPLLDISTSTSDSFGIFSYLSPFDCFFVGNTSRKHCSKTKVQENIVPKQKFMKPLFQNKSSWNPCSKTKVHENNKRSRKQQMGVKYDVVDRHTMEVRWMCRCWETDSLFPKVFRFSKHCFTFSDFQIFRFSDLSGKYLMFKPWLLH